MHVSFFIFPHFCGYIFVNSATKKTTLALRLSMAVRTKLNRKLDSVAQPSLKAARYVNVRE